MASGQGSPGPRWASVGPRGGGLWDASSLVCAKSRGALGKWLVSLPPAPRPKADGRSLCLVYIMKDTIRGQEAKLEIECGFDV